MQTHLTIAVCSWTPAPPVISQGTSHSWVFPQTHMSCFLDAKRRYIWYCGSLILPTNDAHSCDLRRPMRICEFVILILPCWPVPHPQQALIACEICPGTYFVSSALGIADSTSENSIQAFSGPKTRVYWVMPPYCQFAVRDWHRVIEQCGESEPVPHSCIWPSRNSSPTEQPAKGHGLEKKVSAALHLAMQGHTNKRRPHGG